MLKDTASNGGIGKSPTSTLDVSGNITITGALTTGNFNSFLSCLRINGSDTENTLYNGSNHSGITALNNITFNTGTSSANYSTRMTRDTAGNICVGTTNILSRLTVKELYSDGSSGGLSSRGNM